MDGDIEHEPANAEQIVTLGSTSSEVDAHLLADALRRAGLHARAIGAPSVGSLLAGTIFPANILIRSGDYADARAMIEAFEPTGREVLLPAWCPVCKYDTSGLDNDTACPECGMDLGRLARMPREFRFAPPPGTGAGVQKFGAVIGLLALAIIVVLFVGAGIAGWLGYI